MVKTIASNEYNSVSELKNEFKNLLNTPFFLGPLSEQEAQAEYSTNHQFTHPTLLFICEEQFFIVYP